jgi:hypothetical protein
MSESAIVVKEVEQGLAALRERAQAIIVRNADEYTQACQVALDCRAYIKDVGFKLDPGINSAKTHLDFLRNEKSKYTEPAKQIGEIAAQKAEAWKAEERRKAQAEQDRINAENRIAAQRKADEERRAAEAQAKIERERREKELEEARKAGDINKREAARLAKQAAEDETRQRELAAKQAAETAANVQQVKVAAAVPKVAGIKARVNWKFRIVDVNKIPRKFLMPDEVQIGAFVRNNKQAGEVIPGVEAYSEDGI